MRDGRQERVYAILERQSSETLYNFAVDDLHNYAVGSIGVLVHNNCAPNGFSNPKYGQEIHDGFEKALLEQTDTRKRDWIFRTKPGQTGVDATYQGAKDLGFIHAELKPRSWNGYGAYNSQVDRWHQNGHINSADPTSLWFYNEQGAIGQGHITR